MFKATPTSRGRMTLPKPVRDVLQVTAGDAVVFTLEQDGCIRIRRASGQVRDLYGILCQPNLSSPGLRDDCATSLAEDDARIRAASRRRHRSR